MNDTKTLIIVGGGASGIAAAISAKQENSNLRVLVLEKQSAVLKKILATGNGRCNLSNESIDASCYFGSTGIIESILDDFDTGECIAFFDSIGLRTTSEEGRIYPLTYNASSVRELLIQECNRYGVEIKTDCPVDKIIPSNNSSKNRFEVYSGNSCFTGDYLVLAVGGKAGTGCDGDGYKLLKSLGIKYDPISPALVQICTEKEPISGLKGVRVRGSISLKSGDFLKTEEGEIQFTDYGVSGIAAMQLSGYVNDLLKSSQQTVVSIDLCPSMSAYEIKYYIKNRMCTNNLSVAESLLGILGEKLAFKIAESDATDLLEIAEKIKSYDITVTGTKTFKEAQVTRGGVAENELNVDLLESTKIPNLFICGELLNVDGICGGYNLHFAWGSGIRIGSEVAERAAN